MIDDENKKVLVTGITGFIAPLLAERLVKQGYRVYALVRYVTGRKLVTPGVVQVFGDLRDAYCINSIVESVMPDYVLHLAALSAVSESYDHFSEYIDVNFQGTVNLAESCLRQVPHFKQFIFASTSECYGNQTDYPIKESAVLHPNSPYAVSKAAAGHYLEYMRDAYGFPVTLVTPFNSYGRVNNRHFVTERILSQMISGAPVIKLGEPDPVRDLLYRDDHVEAYLSVLGNVAAVGEKINFCTGKGYSIRELVANCANATGWEGTVQWHTLPKRPLDIDVLIGDPSKAASLLGWRSKVDLPTGLRLTAEELKHVN